MILEWSNRGDEISVWYLMNCIDQDSTGDLDSPPDELLFS